MIIPYHIYFFNFLFSVLTLLHVAACMLQHGNFSFCLTWCSPVHMTTVCRLPSTWLVVAPLLINPEDTRGHDLTPNSRAQKRHVRHHYKNRTTFHDEYFFCEIVTHKGGKNPLVQNIKHPPNCRVCVPALTSNYWVIVTAWDQEIKRVD